jgi:hypothetical protein
MSEYDPILGETAAEGEDDLDEVRARFAASSRPYLAAPWPWFAWALILPSAALLTPLAFARASGAGVLFLWSGAILLGGLFEGWALWRHRARTALGGWALRMQGNLSLVALVLSLVLLWHDLGKLLPGLWLLVTGHSFYLLGSLSEPALRRYGITYQVGGALALCPTCPGLVIFAIITGLANAGLGMALLTARRLDRAGTGSTSR